MALKSNYNYHFAIAALVVTGILGMLFVGSVRDHKRLSNPDAARRQGRPLPVVAATIQHRELRVVTGAECELIPGNLFTISSQSGTKITQISVKPGDTVASGDPLVVLDDSVLEKQLINAQDAEKAAAEHAAFMASYIEDLTVLEKRKLLPIVEMLRAREDIAQATRVLSQARQNVIDLQHRLDETRISADESGMVLAVNLHVGATPKPYDTILEIAQLNPLRLLCEFSDTSLPALKNHDIALASFPANANMRQKTTLKNVRPAPKSPGQSGDENLLYANFTVMNEHNDLVPGMRGIVNLEKNITGITVPVSALINQRPHQAETFVIDENNRVSLRSLRLGDYAEGHVEVLEGLAPNDKVVVAGQMYLQDKDEVRITAEAGMTPDS